ncbi:MAG: type II secretion system minor pseudopilin GspI [Gammaproteobacteria bacterium]|nr:type II secretion system minor pseudopilin GspI [Gammaproteobacteria bacterium]
MRPERHGGFTLLEVLVALAVAVYGMLSITLAAITAGSNATSLREQSLAHWVAMNQAAELRLAENWPATGISDGDVDFAGMQWRWNTEISETDVEALRRAEIAVAYAEEPDREIARVVAFVSQPTPGIQFRPWVGQPSNRRGRNQ